MREALYMLGDLGAKVVEITASSSSHIGRERNTDLSVSMPEAVPVAGSSGATVSHGRTTDSSRGTAQTTTFSFPVPKYFPFRNPTHWYYENGLQFPDLQAVVPKLQEQRGERTISLSFAETGEFKSLRELQVDLAQVVGIATVEKRSTLAEFKYTFRVEFYDEASFAEARDWNAPHCSRRVERARWSLSSLGSQRTQYWPKRLSFREDLRLPGEGVVPIEEWLMNYDGVNTIPELFRAQELSNMLYVPFVLYGPRGIDNSTVLFTWQFAVTKSVRTLHTVDTWEQWDTVLSNGRPRGQRRKRYETFMQNVRFDPRGGGVANFDDNIGGADDAETFEQMSEKDVVKLVIHDTPDGSSIDHDVEGIEYPHGLKILVVNGGMVNTLRKEREARKAGEPGDLTDDELEEHEHAWKQAKLFVGPERPSAPDGVPIVIGLDRYPPVACILKFDIGFEVVPEEVVPADERDASVAMVMRELRITQAWPLVALPAPASKADAVALTTQLRGKKEVYEKRMEILEEVAAEAVDVLNNLFSFVTDLEFKLRRQADRAAAMG